MIHVQSLNRNFDTLEHAVSAFCRDTIARTTYGQCTASCPLHELSMRRKEFGCTNRYRKENPLEVMEAIGAVEVPRHVADDGDIAESFRTKLQASRSLYTCYEKYMEELQKQLTENGIDASKTPVQRGNSFNLEEAILSYVQGDGDYRIDDILKIITSTMNADSEAEHHAEEIIAAAEEAVTEE